MTCPKVWDGTAYTRRLHPLSSPISQTLQPLSTVNMELPPQDTISNLEWVEIPIPDGTTEYYRVSSVVTDTVTGQKTVYLEHGACLLDDVIIPDCGNPITVDDTPSWENDSDLRVLSKKDTVANLVSYILGYQPTTAPSGAVRWTSGTIEPTDSIYIEPGNMNLMTALLTMMQSIPQYQMEFEQASASVWRVNVRLRPTFANPVVVACEGRLSRNLKTCEISYSTDGLCTRVYSEFLRNLTPGNVPYLEAGTVGTYGIHSESMSLNDNLSDTQKVQIIGTYLNVHGLPAVSISISGIELSQVTGLSIDKFTVGTVCRLAIPWLGLTVNETIVDRTYSDPYGSPEIVDITLANTAPDLSIAIAAITGGGGVGGSGGGRAGSSGKGGMQEERKRYQTKFEKTDRYFRLLATDSEWDDLGNETVTAYGQLVVTSESIQGVVSDIESSGFSSITQLADSVEIVVSKPTEGNPSKIQAASIAAAINDQNESIVKINADRIYLDADKTFDVSSVFSVNQGSVVISKPLWIYNSTTGNTVTINNGSVNAPTLQVNSGGNLQFSPSTQSGTVIKINHTTAADIITGVQIVGPTNNVYTLQYQKVGTGDTWNNASVTFSRAITSFDAVGGSGTITVTASPQNQNYTLVHSVKEYLVSGSQTNRLLSNVYKDSETATNLIDSKPVFLVENVNNQKVEAHLSTASGTVIAYVSTASTYQAGKAAGEGQFVAVTVTPALNQRSIYTPSTPTMITPIGNPISGTRQGTKVQIALYDADGVRYNTNGVDVYLAGDPFSGYAAGTAGWYMAWGGGTTTVCDAGTPTTYYQLQTS